jgi:hypothetical protein
VLERLAAALRDEGGLLAGALVEPPNGAETPLADIVAAGPRATGHPADLALVVEAVHEGSLLHHGTPRVLDAGDPDLALLAGDRLYALGLERLAAAGDLESVRILARVIADVAAAAAAGRHEDVAAIWAEGARSVAGAASETPVPVT